MYVSSFIKINICLPVVYFVYWTRKFLFFFLAYEGLSIVRFTLRNFWKYTSVKIICCNIAFYCVCMLCNRISNEIKLAVSFSEKFRKKYVCLTCGKSYNHQSNLSRHRNNECNKEKKYSCQFCGYSAYQKTHLLSHMIRKH